MDHLSQLAPIVQELLTTTADQLARETNFVQRQRKVSGSTFAQALIFSFLADSQSAASRIQCMAAAVGLAITRQSLEQRYTPECAAFLKRLLAAATALIVRSPVTLALFDRFTTVEVLDSSIVALPAALAKVYRGGKSGTTKGEPASVKLTVSLDLKTGTLRGPELTDGRAGDLAAELAQAGPPRGGLQLADLGYFCLDKFRRWRRRWSVLAVAAEDSHGRPRRAGAAV